MIQYYDDPSDLEGLVRSLQRIAAPGAIGLIADIPTGATTASDALSLLGLAVKQDHLVDTLRYLVKMRMSEYHDVRAREGVVDYPPEALRALSAELGLETEVLTEQLTVNRSRCHWLIRF